MARDIEAHAESLKHTQERAVAGRTSGLIGMGETVTFEAVHFGVRQRLTSRIVEFDPPHSFADQMVSGAFHSLYHKHEFIPQDGGTLLRDTMIYVSPLGFLGISADKLFLERYMTNFLRIRNAALKASLEQGGSDTIR